MWKSYRKSGEFNTKFLAARQFISPTQAPWLPAASEGLQNRKKYNTSKIYTVNFSGKLDSFETPVTVTPPTRNFKNLKILQKFLTILNVYFWGTSVYFWR